MIKLLIIYTSNAMSYKLKKTTLKIKKYTTSKNISEDFN